jgi:Zn-dependent protease with chaperone function
MNEMWSGRYLDGQTATIHQVLVRIEAGVLVGLTAEGRERAPTAELFRWPASTMAFEDLGPGIVNLTCRGADDASLRTDAVVARLLGLGESAHGKGRAGAGPGGLENSARRGRLALAFGAGIFAMGLVFYFGVTPVARAIAFRVPATAEASLGQGLAAILARQYCETGAARVAAETLAARLGAPAGTELHVLDSETVNAFTFPGGVVILTRGLLEHAEGPDEIAGVLAHELEHVKRRHVMIRFVRTSMLTALWQASVGDYSGLFVIDPRTALDVASLRFSRDDERDADEGALARLDTAHISREGFGAFFDRMREKTDLVPAWLSSHPASAERIATIRGAAARTDDGAASRALSSADWAALKGGCQKK